MPLAPFTEDETCLYLAARGIIAAERCNTIWQVSGHTDSEEGQHILALERGGIRILSGQEYGRICGIPRGKHASRSVL